MTDEIVKALSKQPRSKVHELLSKHGIEDPKKPNVKRDQFLALLRGKYGYTNEKAVDELERLLRQFYRMNRSLGIPHGQSNFKHPHAEQPDTG
jgi:hypothetical protein